MADCVHIMPFKWVLACIQGVTYNPKGTVGQVPTSSAREYTKQVACIAESSSWGLVNQEVKRLQKLGL